MLHWLFRKRGWDSLNLTCRTDVAFLHNCKLTCCTVFLLAAHLFFLLFYFAFQFDEPSMLFRWWWRWRTTTQSISKNQFTSWVQKTTRYDSTKLADLQFSKSEQLSKKNKSFHNSWHLSNWEVLSKLYFSLSKKKHLFEVKWFEPLVDDSDPEEASLG